MSDAAFIKEATEALLVEIFDDDCDDLQSVRAIARTLRAAGQATESSLWFVHDVLHNCRAMLSDQDGAHAEIGRAMGMLRAGQVIPEPPKRVERSGYDTSDEAQARYFPPGFEVEVGVTVEAREKLIARLRGCLPMFNERETVWCCVEGFDLRMAIDLLAALNLKRPA